MNEQELAKAGISPNLVRILVETKHIDNIIADVSQALDKAAG
ncbi:PLP-dependent transferase [Cobetia crustatorum]|uniref:Uncharacterized protein n=1 Tax=Cobetia crustatorum TaxID=553385 RepID=A0A558HKD5_9GAMM|nr:hypothetical protein FQP86_10745 [Cobetia crustatorum]